MAKKGGITIEVGGRTVDVSSPDKVLFPAAGLTKADLARYYAAVADAVLPHVVGRPLTLQRFPNGVDAAGFYSKERPSYFPDWIGSATVPVRSPTRKDEGGVLVMVVVGGAADLVYLANQACTTLHVWTSRADRPDAPDRLVFDLDPADEDLDVVRDAALDLREILGDLGLVPFVKASGSRGLHVEVPLDRSAGTDEVRAFAEAVADEVAERAPEQRTTAFLKAERAGRLYLDVARNGVGQMTVAAYSVRALPEAPVATPLEWDELDDPLFSPRRWTLTTVPGRLADTGDPWADLDASVRPLGPARAALGSPDRPGSGFAGRRRSGRKAP